MNHLQKRRLRWPVPLKWWIIACFSLSIFFYTISALSTIAAVKANGIWIEGNPVMRMLFERFDPSSAVVITETAFLVFFAAIIFYFYKYWPPFIVLYLVHFILIAFFLVSLNDYSHVAPAHFRETLSFVQVIGWLYPINIVLFVVMGFLFTLFVTTEDQKKLS